MEELNNKKLYLSLIVIAFFLLAIEYPTKVWYGLGLVVGVIVLWQICDEFGKWLYKEKEASK